MMLLTPALLCHKGTAQGTQNPASGAFLAFCCVFMALKPLTERHKMPLVGGILLVWRHRAWRQHCKVQPIRAKDLDGSGPMRVLHSATTTNLRPLVGLSLTTSPQTWTRTPAPPWTRSTSRATPGRPGLGRRSRAPGSVLLCRDHRLAD